MKCPYCEGTGEIVAPSFGSLITHFRKKAGLTQDELARAVRKSRGQIANIETDRSDIPLSALKDFAEALNCQQKDLVP